MKNLKKIFESYKIKKIIQAYKRLNKENPNFSEDELCRRLIADRLYITRHTNDIGIQTIEDADYFIRKIFGDAKLTIEETCSWIMLREHVGGSLPKIGDGEYMKKLEANMNKKEEFFKRAQELKNKILKLNH